MLRNMKRLKARDRRVLSTLAGGLLLRAHIHNPRPSRLLARAASAEIHPKVGPRPFQALVDTHRTNGD
jgi:hypothetical protein